MSAFGDGARFPGTAPIDAYGNGGFRFADMSHVGSILCLPDGIYAWDCTDASAADVVAFELLLQRLTPPMFVLFGTGQQQIFPSPEVRRVFVEAGIGLEPMDTGAACRTYNVLLAEQRPLAAALIAVD